MEYINGNFRLLYVSVENVMFTLQADLTLMGFGQLEVMTSTWTTGGETKHQLTLSHAQEKLLTLAYNDKVSSIGGPSYVLTIMRQNRKGRNGKAIKSSRLVPTNCTKRKMLEYLAQAYSLQLHMALRKRIKTL